MQAKPSLVVRIFSALLALVVLVLGFIFSVVVFVLLLAVLGIVLVYVWWKVRQLRKVYASRAAQTFDQFDAGDDGPTDRPAIEGQAKRLDEDRK